MRLLRKIGKCGNSPSVPASAGLIFWLLTHEGRGGQTGAEQERGTGYVPMSMILSGDGKCAYADRFQPVPAAFASVFELGKLKVPVNGANAIHPSGILASFPAVLNPSLKPIPRVTLTR